VIGFLLSAAMCGVRLVVPACTAAAAAVAAAAPCAVCGKPSGGGKAGGGGGCGCAGESDSPARGDVERLMPPGAITSDAGGGPLSLNITTLK